ncbi:MAG: hypothetical protein ACO2ON_03805 [Candidatus Nanopusillus sp.]
MLGYIDPKSMSTPEDRIIDKLVIKYYNAYRNLINLSKQYNGVVPAKIVQNTLMEIFRWEIIERFRVPFSVEGDNAVILYQPIVYKIGFIPFVGNTLSKFLQNTIFLIFDKFIYSPEEFDDTYYFKIIDFMKRLSMYKQNINRSYLRAFLFNNSISYFEYRTTLTLREDIGYFTYFKPLEPDEAGIRLAIVDLYYSVKDLAGHK